ncbi:MAG: hypothetical protein GY774_31240 [Planctomycetes bacterium]|nr:hypothetical protein [Planctomycetota bacterium]
MKRFLLLIGLAILIPLTVLALGAKTESSESVESELKSLKSQVASLEKRVKTLEIQMADRALKDLPFIIPQKPQVPKGWRKRQFNGIPYYVIPLQQNPKK